MKTPSRTILLAALLLMVSCAVFVYEDDSSCDRDGDADTLTIIFSERSPLLGP